MRRRFDLAAAKAVPGFWYVATPYSKYPRGIEAAFVGACRVAAALVSSGLPCFSPIAHSHPIAVKGGLDPYDYAIWLPANEALIDAACGIVVVEMEGWAESYGVGVEIRRFQAAGKPILYLGQASAIP
jgi:hypothetical protein